MGNIIFTVPKPLDDRKKFWRKHLQSVDRAQKTGYAFVGDWLEAGERDELPEGSYILAYDEPGSRANWFPQVRLFRLEADGLKQVYEYIGDTHERSWALGCRDEIADILEKGVANDTE